LLFVFPRHPSVPIWEHYNINHVSAEKEETRETDYIAAAGMMDAASVIGKYCRAKQRTPPEKRETGIVCSPICILEFE